MSIYQCQIINIRTHTNEKGNLSYLENGEIKNFNISRIYYVYNLPLNESRGNHAYKNVCQIVIPIVGAIQIEVDDGQNQKTFDISTPSQGIYIPNGIWRNIHPSTPNTTILVLANKLYKECELISDYKEFISSKNIK